MPSSVVYDTVTCFSLAAMLTTNEAEAPSVTAAALAIDSSVGSSLSLMVPVAVVPSLASVAFTGVLSLTLKVSPSASSTESSTVATVTVFVVAAASNVSVPLAVV